jgi:GNAT superfamily N-acetyltransferase
LFLPGGGSDENEVPEATVVRETREECGLEVRVGTWRRRAIEHVFSVTERAQFEKRSTFCDAAVLHPSGAPTELDHVLQWISVADAKALLTPPSHRWAVGEWLASGLPVSVATMADVPALNELIALSVRGLSVGFYTAAQVDAAMDAVFGVDTQLIADGTYYVVHGSAGPAAAGGWSARGTLYGGDQLKQAEDPMLDPASDAARIRAFFVHPDWARRGLARQLYVTCERAAYAAGFRKFELMATLPGEPLYRALGFTALERVVLTLAGGVEVPFVRMTRGIDGADDDDSESIASPPPS